MWSNARLTRIRFFMRLRCGAANDGGSEVRAPAEDIIMEEALAHEDDEDEDDAPLMELAPPVLDTERYGVHRG